jgi:glutamate 5-kinase
MVTKLTAARIATAAGTTLVITSSAAPEAIPDILAGAQQGTRFKPLASRLRGRKRWLLTGGWGEGVGGGFGLTGVCRWWHCLGKGGG